MGHMGHICTWKMGTLGVVVSPSEVQSTYNQSDRLKVGLTFILKLLWCQFSGCQTLVDKEKRKAILRCTWEGWCHSGTPPCQDARRRPFLDEPLTSLFAAAPAPRCSPLQNNYLSAWFFCGKILSAHHGVRFHRPKSPKNILYILSTEQRALEFWLTNFSALTVAHFCFVGQTEGSSRIK